MATVLFAWELGTGLGHILRIRRLGSRLARHGVRLVAAVKNLASAHLLIADGFQVFQAPVWPGSLSSSSGLEQSSTTLGDMLAGLGLYDGDVLRGMLAAWDQL